VTDAHRFAVDPEYLLSALVFDPKVLADREELALQLVPGPRVGCHSYLSL